MHAIIAFLDVSKAFDRISRPKLICKLHMKGFTGNLLNAISGFLCNRRQRVKINDSYSNEITTLNGVPQGGVSSLLLYIIYVDDVLEVISNAILQALFVDDLAGIWCSHDSSDLIRKINTDFHDIYAWSKQNQQIFAS